MNENLKDVSNTHMPMLSEIEEQGLLAKSIGGKFTYAESGNRKTQDMLNIATLGIEVSPKFYVL